MKRFLIGQYGSFDYQKFNRDFRDDFFGIESCLFESDSDIANLLKEADSHNFNIGIHYPFRAGLSPIRDALFMADNLHVREDAFKLIEQEINYLDRIKPTYILFHFPKPVILDDNVDWSIWRFADQSEYIYESNYTFETFKRASERLFAWLSYKGKEHNFIPILEFDGLNKYVYDDNFLTQLLDKYNDIKICLDTARLYLQETIDKQFDAKFTIKKYAKYAYSIHLSNVQIGSTNNILKSRYPVLPSQLESDGWAPIEQYLTLIAQQNKHVKIMFEHRSEFVTKEELTTCYNWVATFFDE